MKLLEAFNKRGVHFAWLDGEDEREDCYPPNELWMNLTIAIYSST